jgi:hypothetical protein
MILPTIIFFTLSLALSVLTLYKYLAHPPSIFFVLVICIAIYIPISITFLVPIDILSSNDGSSSNFFSLNTKYILYLWKFDYWSAFVLMWALLPFLQEYYRSGAFTQVNRVKDSIRSNIKFYATVAVIGAAGLVYYFLKFGFHFQTFKSLLIALSHTYSLILSLWLMAHGLVNIPKRRWLNHINLEHQLDNLYAELPRVHEELNESTFNFKDICSTIVTLEKISGIQESIFANEVITLLSVLPKDLEFRNHIRSIEYSSIQQLSHSTLSKLNSTLKREETNYRSALFEYDKAKTNILNLQDIVDSKPSKTLKFKHSSNFIKDGRLSFIFHVYIIPFINLAFASLLFILSFIIIESELLHSTKLSIVNELLISKKISATGKFLISFIIISYMSLSSLISLTRVKILKVYHLFPKHSNPVSVVFFTMYANRLTIPLSYNFLTLLKTGEVHSQFNEFLGKSINLSILGNAFNEDLPRLILVPILLTTFNIFDKIKKKFSLDYFEGFASDDEDLDRDTNKRDLLIKEGKLIIQKSISTSSASFSEPRLTFLRTNEVSANSRLNSRIDLTQDESAHPSSDSGTFDIVTKWFSKKKNRLTIQPDYHDEV